MRFLSTRLLAPLALCVLAAGAVAALRQEGMMPTKPGPEHERLAKDVGTWDAKVTFHMGGQTSTSQGTETNTMVCGGKTLESKFTGDMMGMPFEGRGLITWDPAKKKYVGVWTDSMADGMTVMEGTWSEKEGAIVYTYDSEMMGQKLHNRNVTTYPDADHRKAVFYQTPAGGTEAVGMEIDYTRTSR